MSDIKCPVWGCDGIMVAKPGPHKPFYGCSNYKETGCRHKMNVWEYHREQLEQQQQGRANENT